MSKILHITNIELYEYLVADGNTYFYHSVSKSDTIKCGLALRANQNFALYKNYDDGKFRIAKALNGSYSNFLWGTAFTSYRQIDPNYNDFVFKIGNNDNFIFTINGLTYTITNNTVDSELLNCKFGINGKCKYLHFNDNEKLIPAKLKGTLYQGNASDAKVHYEDECGMFDIVNNIFYANESATGTFTVENKIDEIKINGDIKYIAIAEDNIVIYPKRVYFANSNNTLKLVYERPTYDIHIINLAIYTKLGNANKVNEIKFTNNLNLRNLAYNDNVVDVTYSSNIPTCEFLVQNADNDTFTCYIANPFWGENSKIYCYESFSYCFYACEKVTSFAVSNFDTENVTDFSWFFALCKNLVSLDLANFNTKNATTLSYMFYSCKKLANLNIRNFDTRNVNYLTFMFSATNLTELDLSHFDTSNVSGFGSIFRGCTELRYLNISTWNLAKANDISYMFAGIYNIKYLDLSNFNTNSITNINSMFSNSRFNTIKLANNFNTVSVQRFENMFNNCSVKLLISNTFNRTAIQSDSNMFLDCVNVVGENGTIYDVNHIDSEYTRVDGENGLQGYFTNPTNVAKITLVNYDNRNYTDYNFCILNTTYTIPNLQDYTAVVTDNNGNTYTDGDTITITQDITLTFVWSANN